MTPNNSSTGRNILTYFRQFKQSGHQLNFYNYQLKTSLLRPFSVDYFFDNSNSMRKFTLNVLERNLLSENPQLTIVTQLIGRNREQQTYQEMLASIQMNLLNPFISEIHMLQESEIYNSDLKQMIHSEKIKIVNLGRKLMVSDFMEYSNKNLKDRIVILITPNIYFDHTIVHATKIGFNTPLMLSRRQLFSVEKAQCEDKDNCLAAMKDTHDALVFRTTIPFSRNIISKLKTIPLGNYGSENVIMRLFKREYNFEIKNPSESIFLYQFVKPYVNTTINLRRV
ncbi:predicted protein [Naegleria gruberi]|uniref:Predicted protein n=1 Tax=Naegleria gruberi TaxID=5762 RepID=D2VS76_NAEGR|nr:uncharacterized protein NAEGRDRAFT_71840 [Naegleria gruberi]EFC40377.1 predicted protein [Naegleria gruberi]|eukprot:XP_002673121.1 predicted protein [Naegleria gruberi strain NEG-M]